MSGQTQPTRTDGERLASIGMFLPLSLVALLPLQFFSGQFLQYAIVFFVLALIAWVVGARGFAGISMEIARIFILIFIVLAIVSLLL